MILLRPPSYLPSRNAPLSCLSSVRRRNSAKPACHNFAEQLSRCSGAASARIILRIEKVIDNPQVLRDTDRRRPDHLWMEASPPVMAFYGVAVTPQGQAPPRLSNSGGRMSEGASPPPPPPGGRPPAGV